MITNTRIVEPKSATAIDVARGDVLTVEDLDGGQVADFVCFAGSDHRERFSQARTRVRNWSTSISTGGKLVSNRDNVMFTIVVDSVGVHDLLFCPCHSWVYEHVYEVGPRDGCFENLSRAVSGHGIAPDDVPDPFNIFMSTAVGENGELVLGASPSRKGDTLSLRAEMDCLVAVSACADDVSDCNNGVCTRIGLSVST